MNDFYVGYLPKAPGRLVRFVRGTIFVLTTIKTSFITEVPGHGVVMLRVSQ